MLETDLCYVLLAVRLAVELDTFVGHFFPMLGSSEFLHDFSVGDDLTNCDCRAFGVSDPYVP